MGFALSVCNIAKLVESFVCFNDLGNAKLYLKYRERKGCPRLDWINPFLKQNNLSLKEAAKLTAARYIAIKYSITIFWFANSNSEKICKLLYLPGELLNSLLVPKWWFTKNFCEF